MSKSIGTVVRGVRTPIIRQGDDLVKIVVDSLLTAAQSENIEFQDRDIVAATEAIVARAQGNYVSVDEIAEDIKAHFPGGHIGVIFPILSRNRFSICLKGIARGAKKITLMLSYPSDEVGNHLVSLDALDEKGINPYTDVLTEAQYRQAFGRVEHPFTGVDYIEYYKELIQGEGAEVEIILGNNAQDILPYAKDYLRVILIGAPWMTASLVLNNQLRFQGNAIYGTIGIASGAVLNIGLDPLLIFVFDLGVAGAAWATIISQFAGFCLLLAGCTRGATLHIHISRVQLKWSYFKLIIQGGLPSLARQSLASVATICLNHAAMPYGDAAIAAMGVVQRITTFGASAMIGFGQGFQPVCGFNYGARLYHRCLLYTSPSP